jgi:cell division transport system permease protein
MTTWLAQHLYALIAALAKLKGNPIGSIFNMLAMGIALALPAVLYAALLSIENWSGERRDRPQLSILLEKEAGDRAFDELAARLKAHPEIYRVEPRPRDAALKMLEEKLELENIAATIGENPLPHAFVVQTKSDDVAVLTQVRDEIVGWPAVSEVIWDAEWMRKLQALVRFGESAVAILAGLLAFGVLAITFNTVRLHVLTQRTEIEVASLIGATRAFIRRPFLYFGALQGLLGALACGAIVAAVVHLLQRSLEPINSVYGSDFVLTLPSPFAALGLAAVAAGLGWLGAFASVARHLAAFAPRA